MTLFLFIFLGIIVYNNNLFETIEEKYDCPLEKSRNIDTSINIPTKTKPTLGSFLNVFFPKNTNTVPTNQSNFIKSDVIEPRNTSVTIPDDTSVTIPDDTPVTIPDIPVIPDDTPVTIPDIPVIPDDTPVDISIDVQDDKPSPSPSPVQTPRSPTNTGILNEIDEDDVDADMLEIQKKAKEHGNEIATEIIKKHVNKIQSSSETTTLEKAMDEFKKINGDGLNIGEQIDGSQRPDSSIMEKYKAIWDKWPFPLQEYYAKLGIIEKYVDKTVFDQILSICLNTSDDINNLSDEEIKDKITEIFNKNQDTSEDLSEADYISMIENMDKMREFIENIENKISTPNCILFFKKLLNIYTHTVSSYLGNIKLYEDMKKYIETKDYNTSLKQWVTDNEPSYKSGTRPDWSQWLIPEYEDPWRRAYFTKDIFFPQNEERRALSLIDLHIIFSIEKSTNGYMTQILHSILDKTQKSSLSSPNHTTNHIDFYKIVFMQESNMKSDILTSFFTGCPFEYDRHKKDILDIIEKFLAEPSNINENLITLNDAIVYLISSIINPNNNISITKCKRACEAYLGKNIVEYLLELPSYIKEEDAILNYFKELLEDLPISNIYFKSARNILKFFDKEDLLSNICSNMSKQVLNSVYSKELDTDDNTISIETILKTMLEDIQVSETSNPSPIISTSETSEPVILDWKKPSEKQLEYYINQYDGQKYSSFINKIVDELARRWDLSPFNDSSNNKLSDLTLEKLTLLTLGDKNDKRTQAAHIELNRKILELETLKQKAATIIQKFHRGKMGRKKASIRKKYSLPEHKIEQDEIISEKSKDVIETDAIGSDAIELNVGEIDAQEQDGLGSDAIELDVGEPGELDKFEDILKEVDELAKEFEEESGISLETREDEIELDDIKLDVIEPKDIELEEILKEFKKLSKKIEDEEDEDEDEADEKNNISPMSQGEVENITLNKDNYSTTLKNYIIEALDAQDEERLNALITIITVGQPDVKESLLFGLQQFINKEIDKSIFLEGIDHVLFTLPQNPDLILKLYNEFKTRCLSDSKLKDSIHCRQKSLSDNICIPAIETGNQQPCLQETLQSLFIKNTPQNFVGGIYKKKT